MASLMFALKVVCVEITLQHAQVIPTVQLVLGAVKIHIATLAVVVIPIVEQVKHAVRVHVILQVAHQEVAGIPIVKVLVTAGVHNQVIVLPEPIHVMQIVIVRLVQFAIV